MTAPAKEEALKPCPFCGGEPKFVQGKGAYGVRCTCSGTTWIATFSGGYVTTGMSRDEARASAIAAWNRRAPAPAAPSPSADAEMVEALKAEVDAANEELGRVIMACPPGYRTSPASEGVRRLREAIAKASLPVSLAGAVKVKPLEWFRPVSYAHSAHTSFGSYVAFDHGDNWGDDRYSLLFAHQEQSRHESLEDAQSAALADFQRRTQDCIVHVSPAPEAVAAGEAATSQIDDDLRALLHGVEGVVEANSFEHSALWERFHDKLGHSWVENLSGRLPTIGHVGGLPVCLSLRTAVVSGHKILFWEATSQVVDYRMADAWLVANLPRSAFQRNADLLNRANAQNFHNVLFSLKHEAQAFLSPAREAAPVEPMRKLAMERARRPGENYRDAARRLYNDQSYGGSLEDACIAVEDAEAWLRDHAAAREAAPSGGEVRS